MSYPGSTIGVMDTPIKSKMQINAVEVYNIMGRKILAEQFEDGEPINIESLPEGIYLLKTLFENNKYNTQTLMIK